MHGKHDILDKIKPLVPQNKKKAFYNLRVRQMQMPKKMSGGGGRNNNLIISWSQR